MSNGKDNDEGEGEGGEHPVDELIDRIEECKRAFLARRDVNIDLLKSEIGLNVYAILEEIADVFSGWIGAVDDSLSKLEENRHSNNEQVDLVKANEVKQQIVQVGNLTARLMEIVKTKLASDEEAISVTQQLENILEATSKEAQL